MAQLLMITLAALAITGVSNPGGKPAPHGKPPAHRKAARANTNDPPSATPDIRIMVYVFSFGSTTTGDEDARGLVTAINDLGVKNVYHACSKGTTDSVCSADTAMVFVSGSVLADGTVQLTSADAGLQALGSASVQEESALSQMDASSLAPLLGRAQVGANLQLSLVPAGYQQFVQLVPASVGSNVPDYSGMLIYLLSRRGISAFRSQMTIGAAGSNPGSRLCTQGEEYFLYSINTITSPHVLIGTTKLNSFISGAFLDCNDQTRNRPNRDEPGFSGDASKTIPTTKGSALTYAALLAIAVPHLGWTSINSGIAAAGGFADMDPTSQAVQSAVVESALRNLIDNFCATQPSPAPSPSPIVSLQSPPRTPRGPPRPRTPGTPTRAPHSGVGGAGSSTTGNAGGAATTVALDPTQVALGTNPYDPRCYRPVEPEPTPSPTGSTQASVIQNAVTSFERSMYPAPSPSP